ncbi:LSM domain protein [Paenibacillus sp. FSL K6-2524]|uniref:LSM domain protein n=1 Tax=Paenibacillus sp. FSL K6-2524 TaxID=2954516 RepID=UPI0030FCB8D6
MDPLTSYMHKRLRILTKQGEMFEGEAITYDVGIMEDRDYDSIGLDQGTHIAMIDEPDIKSIEVID